MTAKFDSVSTTRTASTTCLARTVRGGGHIGLVVLGSIASVVALSLVLVLGFFAGGTETEITGSDLLALGFGFTLLAAAARSFTDQPQTWAFAPGVGSAAAGLAVVFGSPSSHVLGLAGWLWPVFLLILIGWCLLGARRTLHNWSRRVLIYPALVALLLIAAGGAFETIAEATTSNPAPRGSTYLANGHQLYLNCECTGSPTVVLFNGLGERTPSWAWVQRTLSSSTRVCSFDRAGQGWSGASTGRQDGHQLASDLHDLLRTARIPGPYLLAGHSVGGTYGLIYAAQYPDDVAGVALIDSATPYQFDLAAYPAFYSAWRRASALLPLLSRVGAARVFSRMTFATLPPDARRAARAFGSSPRELRSDRLEFAELPTVFEQAKAVTTLDGKPLAVLTADVGEMGGWSTFQNKLARLSTNSEHRTAHGATHAALLEDPTFAAITSRTIGEVVRAVRNEGR